MWPIKRNIASMRVLCQLAENYGISLAECLRHTQVSIAQLNDPYAQVSAEQELQLVENLLAAQKTSEHTLGLVSGGYYHLNTFGIWGFALINSPTLRDAMNLGLRYLDLTFAFTQVQQQEHDDDICLILEDSAIPLSCRRFLLDRDMSSIMTMVTELFNHRPLLKQVSFKYPPPKDINIYQHVFGITPQFNAQHHAVCFSKAFLDLAISHSNPHAAAMCEAQCRELLRRRQQRSGTAAKVRDFLLVQPQTMPSIEQVANHLCMSSRTLRRHLTAEQVSYRLLADEVRMTLAEELLKIPSLTLEEIARRVGYSEVSNFLHAFKRCKQQTPSQYRKSLC